MQVVFSRPRPDMEPALGRAARRVEIVTEAALNQFSRNLMLWAIIVLAMVMLFNMFQQPQAGLQRVPYTEFLNKVDDGQVLSVTIQGHTLTGKTRTARASRPMPRRIRAWSTGLLRKRWKSRPSRRKSPLGI